MFEHIQILSYILLILGATWLVFFLHNAYNRAPYRYMKAIRNYNIAIVILFALRLAFFYTQTNMMDEAEPSLVMLFNNLVDFSLSVLMIMMILLMLQIFLSFRNIFPTVATTILYIICIVVAGFFYAVSIFFPESAAGLIGTISGLLNNSFTLNLIIHNLEFLLIIFFLFSWKKNFRDKGRKRISQLFSWFYIACNSISLVMLVLMMQIQMDQILQWAFKVLVMALFVLAPYLWVNRVFIPYSKSMLKLINRSGEMQAIFLKHNITRREAEIIELILEGKGNHEIKDSLFISYHTVKNHLSNIFRKLGVSNRHELVHLFISGTR